MDRSNPVVHSSSFESSLNATEYFLPQPDIPTQVQSKLSAWILEIIASSGSQLESVIEGRIDAIEHPDLQTLCEQLRSYVPMSVVIREDGKSWLRLNSPHDSRIIGSSTFLPPLPDQTQINRQLDLTLFSSNMAFSAFVRGFAGLAEDFQCSGNFLEDSEEWMSLSEDWQESIIDNYHDWYGSLLIYHARNSDQLLLHPNGSIGWWKYGEGTVTREHDSFTDFVKFYVKYRKEIAFPFDSYGPPDYPREDGLPIGQT